MSKVLLTGGAGYIGSHCVHWLLQEQDEKGNPLYEVFVLDNLSSGHQNAVSSKAYFIKGDIGDSALLKNLFCEQEIDSVIHLAAFASVEESVLHPDRYYRNNVCNTANLVDSCLKGGVRQFIFSSSCSVYGSSKRLPVTEQSETLPESPYGRSKLVGEWCLQDAALSESNTQGFRFACLRYFNVAGAHVEGGLGQATPKATQLIKVASEVATGKREKLTIYGSDYPTVDGTCVRDYIHVDDLAIAHCRALRYLEAGGESLTVNCGYGKGYSVKEVAETMQKVSGKEFAIEYAPRRAGDASAVFADNTLAQEALGFKPRFDDLNLICKTAYDWECNPTFKNSF